ncbi:MAG TPA: hypothetical protein IAC03_05630 [Candidatus Coprenecus pullistercoris]|nr:hypothetical protein [Candidatus Coprenecus pullistercoris]
MLQIAKVRTSEGRMPGETRPKWKRPKERMSEGWYRRKCWGKGWSGALAQEGRIKTAAPDRKAAAILL